jgi:hypothetical protein
VAHIDTIKIKFQPLLVGIWMGSILRMSNFKILSLFLCFCTPNLLPIVPSNWFTVKLAKQNSRFLPFLGEICMEGTLTPKKQIFCCRRCSDRRIFLCYKWIYSSGAGDLSSVGGEYLFWGVIFFSHKRYILGKILIFL